MNKTNFDVKMIIGNTPRASAWRSVSRVLRVVSRTKIIGSYSFHESNRTVAVHPGRYVCAWQICNIFATAAHGRTRLNRYGERWVSTGRRGHGSRDKSVGAAGKEGNVPPATRFSRWAVFRALHSTRCEFSFTRPAQPKFSFKTK